MGTKYDWVGSSNKLAYPINASDTNTTWGLGISASIGYEPCRSKLENYESLIKICLLKRFSKVVQRNLL